MWLSAGEAKGRTIGGWVFVLAKKCVLRFLREETAAMVSSAPVLTTSDSLSFSLSKGFNLHVSKQKSDANCLSNFENARSWLS